MKQISLTQNQVALVDDDDYEYLNQWKWRAKWSPASRSFYAVRTSGKRPHRDTVYMARLISKTTSDMDCDHINHDTLDNRKQNLRNISHKHNTRNRRTYSNNLLKEKNIRTEETGFRVRIVVDGSVVFSKHLSTLDDAISCRNAALLEIHGEYACIPSKED